MMDVGSVIKHLGRNNRKSVLDFRKILIYVGSASYINLTDNSHSLPKITLLLKGEDYVH